MNDWWAVQPYIYYIMFVLFLYDLAGGRGGGVFSEQYRKGGGGGFCCPRPLWGGEGLGY